MKPAGSERSVATSCSGRPKSRAHSPPLASEMFALYSMGLRKDGGRVRLYSRLGNDMTRRFPLIVDALARVCSRSCIIDGEACCLG